MEKGVQKGEIIRERKEAEYDIYGLDSEDIEADKIVKKLVGFGIFGSFRTWYILQHCNLYNGDYQPFITYASFKKTVRGSIK